MNTNILKSHIVKQLLGALGGMAIAVVFYTSLQNLSDLNIAGQLVQSGVVSESSSQSSVGDKDIDDETLRRLASRAQTVTKELQEATPLPQVQAPETMQVAPVEEHEGEAQATDHTGEQFTFVPISDVNPNDGLLSEEQRLMVRAARMEGVPASSETPTVVPLELDNPSEEELAMVRVAEAAEAQHAGAPHMEPSELSNAGLGLNLLILSTLVVLFVVSSRYRKMLTSLVQGVR